MVKGSAVRQAVVRLQSQQTLAQVKSNGEVGEASAKVKEVKEYVVLQRRIWKEREEPWKVWGTVEETDWKTVVP